MIRKFKLLTIATTTLALSASAALGHTPAQFHAASAPVNLTGSQSVTFVLGFDPGSVHCLTINFSGSQSAKTFQTQKLGMTYSSCQLKSVFGNINVTVDFKGCDQEFNASGVVKIVCEAGEGPVTISGPGCTITVPAQTLNPGVEYTHSGSGTTTDLVIHNKITTMGYSYSGFLCGSGSSTTNGTVTGAGTLKGSNAFGHVAIARTPTIS